MKCKQAALVLGHASLTPTATRMMNLKSSGVCFGLERMAWIAFVVTKFLLLCSPIVGTSVLKGTGAFKRVFSVFGF